MKNLRSLVLLTCACPAWVAMAQITVDTMAPLTVCGSATVSIAFSTPDVFNAGNVFTVQLSDASGSFAAPTVIGSAPGTGGGTISCSFPAGIVGGSGQAIRVLSSDPLQTGEVYSLPITTVQPANAGLNGVVSVCSSDAPINLFAMISGNPDTGGAWAGPLGAMNGVFDPATDPAGPYTYVVNGVAPCLQSAAMVLVTVAIAPEAGNGGAIAVCSSDPPFNMLTQLGGSPQTGGTWTNPGGAPQPPTFTPGLSLPGCYTYMVAGIAPCPNASSALCITVSPVANAGANATLNWCLSSGALDLFAQLGGAPQPGGTWTDDSATGALSGATFNPAGVPSGTYVFTYTVGGGACPAASASVTVNHSGVCIVPPQYPYPVE